MNKLYDEFDRNEKMNKTKEPIKMVLMSDLHVDYDYTPGMSNNCGKFLCCQSDSGLPTKESEAAGKWGDYQCDLSPKLAQNMLNFIKESI